MLLCCGAICGGGVQEGTMSLAQLSASFQAPPLPPTGKLALLVLIPGWVSLCIFRTLWISPTNSPVRLEVSPATSAPTGFFSQKFWGCISPHWNPGLCGLSRSPVVPPGLSTCKYGSAHSASHGLIHPGPQASSLPWVLSAPAAHLHYSYQSGWMFLL